MSHEKTAADFSFIRRALGIAAKPKPPPPTFLERAGAHAKDVGLKGGKAVAFGGALGGGAALVDALQDQSRKASTKKRLLDRYPGLMDELGMDEPKLNEALKEISLFSPQAVRSPSVAYGLLQNLATTDMNMPVQTASSLAKLQGDIDKAKGRGKIREGLSKALGTEMGKSILGG
jgi:hypothetical protein